MVFLMSNVVYTGIICFKIRESLASRISNISEGRMWAMRVSPFMTYCKPNYFMDQFGGKYIILGNCPT